VSTAGEAVVLNGTVQSEKERRIAEIMLRMTPGVREVRNQLQVPGR
jgi:osmotically-inducible protein OsmY